MLLVTSANPTQLIISSFTMILTFVTTYAIISPNFNVIPNLKTSFKLAVCLHICTAAFPTDSLLVSDKKNLILLFLVHLPIPLPPSLITLAPRVDRRCGLLCRWAQRRRRTTRVGEGDGGGGRGLWQRGGARRSGSAEEGGRGTGEVWVGGAVGNGTVPIKCLVGC